MFNKKDLYILLEIILTILIPSVIIDMSNLLPDDIKFVDILLGNSCILFLYTILKK